MTKQLYIIDYENAHWCGGQLNVLVWARSESSAVELAEDHMQDAQFELFSDEFAENRDEDESLDEECPYVVNDVSLFGPFHDQWEFYQNPDQAEFYPVIGEQ